MDAGSHAAFIMGAYVAAILIIAALIVWVRVDYRRQQRLIADLETRGVTRRSARSEEKKP